MYNRLIVFLLVTFIAVSSSSCTLQFKAKELELDTETPQGTIGRTKTTNTTYQLDAIEIAKRD